MCRTGGDYDLLNKQIAWLEKQGEQKFAEGTFVNVDDVREDFVKEVYRVLDADSTNDRANQIIDAFDNLPTVTIKQDPCDNCKMTYSTCYSFPCDEKKAFEQGKTALEAINEEKVDNQFCVKTVNNVEPKFKVGDIIINIHYKWDGRHRIKKIVDEKYIFDDGSCINIKEQNNWKLYNTNKDEQEFHIGDWIVFTNTKILFLIKSYNSGYYTLEDTNGNTHFPCMPPTKEDYHLWSIEDAKAGDVLHASSFSSDCIFIFDRLDKWKFDEPNGDRAVATGYCCLTLSADNMEFGIQGPDCIEVDTVKPATKIQRDLLFQKMKEAGYEWDTEKKELKKIENETEIPFGAKDSELQEVTYYIPKGFHAEIDGD
jgi:hypothetical protein